MLRRNSASEPAQWRGPSRQSQRCDPFQGSPRPRSTRPGGLGGLSGLLRGSMMTDAPAEALGFDAPGSILGLTRGGRARGVKSVPRGGAQAGDQRRSSSSSRLTSADGACRMRPVGVGTDSKSPCSSFRPKTRVWGSYREDGQGLRRFCAGRQGASAYGPAWAAPRKHRPPSTRECRPACWRGTGQDAGGQGDDEPRIERIAAPRVRWVARPGEE